MFLDSFLQQWFDEKSHTIIFFQYGFFILSFCWFPYYTDQNISSSSKVLKQLFIQIIPKILFDSIHLRLIHHPFFYNGTQKIQFWPNNVVKRLILW